MSLSKAVPKRYDDVNRCTMILLHPTGEEGIKAVLEQEFAGLDVITGVRAQAKASEILQKNKQAMVLRFYPDGTHPCSGEAKKIKQVARLCQDKKVPIEKIPLNGDLAGDLDAARKYCRTKFKRR